MVKNHQTKLNKPKENVRDASSKSNGYLYQRMYAVYYFLDEEIKEIIEEGSINEKTYEDITIYKKDGKKITYQIKHHKSTEGLGMSSDVYKTMSNDVNNEMDEIIYLVSKSEKNTFTEELEKFNKNNPQDNYEMIKNKKDKEATNENYKKTIKLFEEFGEEKTLKYLEKYKFEEGLKYKNLTEEIEKKINEKIKIDDKMKIKYMRYKIFDLFTDNSFGDNKLLEKDKEYKKIFNEIKDEKKLEYNEEIIKLLLKNNYNDFDNFDEEIKTLNLDEKDIESQLNIIEYLHKMYKDEKIKNDEKIKIKKCYKESCKRLCENIVIKIKKCKIDIIKFKSDISKSLGYYYDHPIENSIDLEKSGINCLLEKKGKSKLPKENKNKSIYKKEL
jgi:hypothetical protein